MLSRDLLLPPDRAVGNLAPSTQDEETLAANLSEVDWNKVAQAVTIYQLVTEQASLGDRAAQEADIGERVPPRTSPTTAQDARGSEADSQFACRRLVGPVAATPPNPA